MLRRGELRRRPARNRSVSRPPGGPPHPRAARRDVRGSGCPPGGVDGWWNHPLDDPLAGDDAPGDRGELHMTGLGDPTELGEGGFRVAAHGVDEDALRLVDHSARLDRLTQLRGRPVYVVVFPGVGDRRPALRDKEGGHGQPARVEGPRQHPVQTEAEQHLVVFVQSGGEAALAAAAIISGGSVGLHRTVVAPAQPGTARAASSVSLPRAPISDDSRTIPSLAISTASSSVMPVRESGPDTLLTLPRLAKSSTGPAGRPDGADPAESSPVRGRLADVGQDGVFVALDRQIPHRDDADRLARGGPRGAAAAPLP